MTAGRWANVLAGVAALSAGCPLSAHETVLLSVSNVGVVAPTAEDDKQPSFESCAWQRVGQKPHLLGVGCSGLRRQQRRADVRGRERRTNARCIAQRATTRKACLFKFPMITVTCTHTEAVGRCGLAVLVGQLSDWSRLQIMHGGEAVFSASGRAAPFAFAGCGCLLGLRHRAQCEPQAPTFSICTYNLLCPTYAVKWKEQQGMAADGSSNWPVRWPVMRDILQRGQFDVLCLQEVENTELDSIVADLGSRYRAKYFKHSRRPPDGLLIAVKSSAFKASPEWILGEHQGVDLEHPCGAKIRVVTGHMKGGRPAQLQAFAEFASAESSADVEILTADFNEDFAEQGRSEGVVRCPFGHEERPYSTLPRALELPQLSRPPNKQDEGQSSGKGKVDYIWVRERTKEFRTDMVCDPLSRRAIIESHRNCDATGEWPSDHGCEAFSVQLQRGNSGGPCDSVACSCRF
ncbi:Calm4 [Symbiodinium microadriaticum]|nr:Calm4 [Symbiodinium microadriaticum]